MSLMWSQEGVHCPVVILLLMPNLLLALQLKLRVLLCWLPSGPHHGYEGLLFRTQGQGCGWDMSSRSRLIVAIAAWLVVVVYRYWGVVVCCTLVVVLPGCSISLVGPVLVPVVIVAVWLLWYVGLLPLCVVVSGLGRVVPLQMERVDMCIGALKKSSCAEGWSLWRGWCAWYALAMPDDK